MGQWIAKLTGDDKTQDAQNRAAEDQATATKAAAEKTAKATQEAAAQATRQMELAAARNKLEMSAAEQANNKASQKRPDIAGALASAMLAGKAGSSGTMLTGPGGIDPGALQLGKSTLLGG